MSKFSIGHDVEVIAMLEGVPQLLTPEQITGTKKDPVWSDQGSIQLDNVMLEVGQLPSTNALEWVTRCLESFQLMQDTLGALGYTYSMDSIGNFSDDIYELPSALEIACEPEFSIYTRNREVPNAYTMGNTRTCGGHIHIGGDLAQKHPRLLIEALDTVLYSWAVANRMTSMEREGYYGGAGYHRIKEYGIEYRALDNGWYVNRQFGKIYSFVEEAVNYAEAQLSDAA